jgi:hypothetical protein
MNNVCPPVYALSALFFCSILCEHIDILDFFASLRLSDLSLGFEIYRYVMKKSHQVSQFLRKMTGQKTPKFKKRSDFGEKRERRYFSSRGDHASKTLTKRRSQIISVKKNRYTRRSSYNR